MIHNSNERKYREDLAVTTTHAVKSIARLARIQDSHLIFETTNSIKQLRDAGHLVDTRISKDSGIPNQYIYELQQPCVIPASSIHSSQTNNKSIADIKTIPIVSIKGDLREACESYPEAIVFCDINPIVMGGGFRVGDKSNEAMLCYGSTLFLSLADKGVRMHFHCSNASKGRWGQDSVVVVPNVTYFMGADAIKGTMPIGCRFLSKQDWTSNIFFGITPPNMTCTSHALKFSRRTRAAMDTRIKALFELSVLLPNDKTLIVPLLGYRTFNIPLEIITDSLIKALTNLNTSNITQIVLVFDQDMNDSLVDAIRIRISNIQESLGTTSIQKFYI